MTSQDPYGDPFCNLTSSMLKDVSQAVSSFIFNNLACTGQQWEYMHSDCQSNQLFMAPPSLDISMCPGKAFNDDEIDTYNEQNSLAGDNSPSNLMNYSFANEGLSFYKEKLGIPQSPTNKTLSAIIETADKKNWNLYVDSMVSHFVPCFLLCPTKPCRELVLFFHANAEDLSTAYSFCLQLQKTLDVAFRKEVLLSDHGVSGLQFVPGRTE